MIILINAPSSTGKTYLAKQLVGALHYSCVSMDHIKMGWYRGGLECPFHPEDEDQLIVPYLWPIIKGMMETCIENHQDHIIEGIYVDFKDLSKCIHQYPDQIISINICFSKEYIIQHIDDIFKYRHIIEKRGYEDTRSLDQFIQEHTLFKKECQLAELPLYEITTDYKGSLDKIKKRIISKLK